MNWRDIMRDWLGYKLTERDIPAHDWRDHDVRTAYIWCHVELGVVNFVAPDPQGKSNIAVVFTNTGVSAIVDVLNYKVLTLYVTSEMKLCKAYRLARKQGWELPFPTETVLAIRELYKNQIARHKLEMW